MDVFANLWLGLTVAMSFTNLLYCFVGVFLGTAIGVLPGLGPVATIAMLLPVTFGLPPVSALVGIVAFCVVVFVKGLGVPMPLIGTWFGG